MIKTSFHLFSLLYLFFGICRASASEPPFSSLPAEKSKDADELFNNVILVRLNSLDGHFQSLNNHEPFDFPFDRLVEFRWDLAIFSYGYMALLNCSFDRDKMDLIEYKFDRFNTAFIDLISKLVDFNLKGLLKFITSQDDLRFKAHLVAAANRINLFQVNYSPYNIYLNSFVLIFGIITQQFGKYDDWLDRIKCLQILKAFLERELKDQFPKKQKNSFSSIFKGYLLELEKIIFGFREDFAINDDSAIEKRIEEYVKIHFCFQDILSKDSQTKSFDRSTKDKPNNYHSQSHFESAKSILMLFELKRDAGALDSHLQSLIGTGISSLKFNQISIFLNDSKVLFDKSCCFDGDVDLGISLKRIVTDLILEFRRKLVIPFFEKYQPHFLGCLSGLKDMNLMKFFITLLNLNQKSDFEDQSDDRACFEVFQLIDKMCKSQINALVQMEKPDVCLESLIKILNRIANTNLNLKLGYHRIYVKNYIAILSDTLQQFRLIEKDKFNLSFLPELLKESLLNYSPPIDIIPQISYIQPSALPALSNSPAYWFEKDFQAVESRLIFSGKIRFFDLQFSEVIAVLNEVRKLLDKIDSFNDRKTKKSMKAIIDVNLLIFWKTTLIPIFEKDQSDFMCNLSENNDLDMIKFVIVLLNLESDDFDFSDLCNRRVYNYTYRIINRIYNKEINTEAEWQQTVQGLAAFLKILPKFYNPDLKSDFLNLQLEKSFTILSEIVRLGWVMFDGNRGLFNESILKSSLLSIFLNSKGLYDRSNDAHVAIIIFLLQQYYLRINVEAASPILLLHIFKLRFMSPFVTEKKTFYNILGDSNNVYQGLWSLLEAVKSSRFIKSSLNRDDWLAQARIITSW
jgi:hypothetical protein